jgi:hypothetical protein
MTGDHPDVLDMKSGFVLIPIGVFSPSEYKLLGQDKQLVDIHSGVWADVPPKRLVWPAIASKSYMTGSFVERKCCNNPA